jgi:hypothetical protein
VLALGDGVLGLLVVALGELRSMFEGAVDCARAVDNINPLTAIAAMRVLVISCLR